MQLEAVISGLIAGAATGFIAGGIFGWLSGWQYSAKLIELERKINQIWGSFNSGRGVDARQQQDQETQEVLAQAVSIWKSEGDQSKKIDGVLALAAQHPKVAMKLLKQVGISL